MMILINSKKIIIVIIINLFKEDIAFNNELANLTTMFNNIQINNINDDDSD